MGSFLHPGFSFLHCRTQRTALASLWIIGLLFGAVIALSADTFLVPTMLSALQGSLSIFGLLIALLLPLLITALAVYISQPILLFPLAFLKAFLFAFSAVGVFASVGESAWLIKGLLMFSDTLALPFLWWLWLQVVDSEDGTVLRCMVPAAVFVVLIGCFDYAFVAPFMARLI